MTKTYGYLIHATGKWALTDYEKEANPPIKTKIRFNDCLWMERIKSEVADKIMYACEPRGLNFNPTMQNSHVYAFVFNCKSYDIDDANYVANEFSTIMALSRLIRPTSISYKYCAMVIFDDKEQITKVIPASGRGRGCQVYVQEQNRDWLTMAEAESLKDLYDKYISAGIEGPIRSAFWYHEYSQWEYYIEFRWLYICAALECLVNNDKKRVTKQFSYRLKMLSEHINHPISESSADQFYDMRSKLIHGDPGENWDHDNDLVYQLFEQFIRSVVRKAIEDPELANLLSSSQKVADRWPLPPIG